MIVAVELSSFPMVRFARMTLLSGRCATRTRSARVARRVAVSVLWAWLALGMLISAGMRRAATGSARPDAAQAGFSTRGRWRRDACAPTPDEFELMNRT